MKTSKIILLVVALAGSVGISQAQTLLVRFPLNDTGGGTSVAPDPAGEANGFSMPTLTKGGVPGTFQGSPGGGVSGLGVALDFSTNSDFTTVGEGGATGAGPVGEVTNAALNFGFVSAFTATVWFKAVTNMPATNLNGNWDLGPRIFILGNAAAADKGVGNSIGLFYQQWNCLAYSIGTNEITLPCFTSPLVVSSTTNFNTNTMVTTTNYFTNAFVPTGQWLFYAITYDGGNVATIYSGTDQSAVTTVLATTATTNVLTTAQVAAEGAFNGADALASTPQGIGPGATGMPATTLNFLTNSVLYLGNRQSRARSLDGWINDFRFYGGTLTPNGVEDIRWAAIAPINFTAVPNNGDTQVTLSWNAVGGASGYNLLRGSVTGGPYSTVLLNNQNQTSYVDSPISPTGNYFYVVQAVDANGGLTTGPNSVEVSYLGSPPPAVPTGLTATTPAPSEVVLNWASSGSPAADSFTVSRSTISGQESFLATITGPTPPTTYTDTSGVNGVKYFYKVSATSAAGTPSAKSSEANATPFGPPEAPNASAASTGLAITVNWTDPNPPNIQAVDTFIILRSVNAGPYSQIATPGVGTSSYNDTGLTVGNTYSYEVEAVNNNGTSPPSSATAPIQITQQLTIQDIAEQTVRAAADHAGVVNDNGSGTIPGFGAANAVGFLRVKWVSDGNPGPADTTSCAKTYLRWSFAGNPPPDTNSDLTLTWTTIGAGVPTTMTLWSLDQPYQFVTGVPAPPGDGSSFVPPGSASTGITWDIAQANDTNYNPFTLTGTFQMLTNGPFTATPLTLFTATAQNNAPAPVVVIPAPWGKLIHGNELVFVVGGTNVASTQANAGYRIVNHSPALIYNQVLGTTPPSMSFIPDISLNVNQTSSTISFTITDPDDGGAGGVAAATVTVLNDTTGGTTPSTPSAGATQQFTVTAGPNPGTASLEVTIADSKGDFAQRTFTVTVLPPISISTPAPTNTLASTPVVVPFTVADNLLNEPQNQLTMHATVDAQSGTVLATAAATPVGGNNWTVTITPTGNTNGIGFVDLSVTDTGSHTASTAVAVMVQANPEVVLSETFNYTGSSSLLLENGSVFGTPPTVNDGIWSEIGPTGPILAVSASGNSLDFAVNGNGEEGYANLLGGPYAPGHGYVLYTTFQANWSAFTSVTWLSLGRFSGVGGFQYAGVGNTPDLAADGGFNATIVNGPGGAVVRNPETLALGTTYNIATRYDVDRATATLWINAANEADPTATNITATDVQAPAQISDITLNQNGVAGAATVIVNDLTVSVVARPTINSISIVGSNVQIVFTASVGDSPSTFGVSSTTDLTIPFSAASPAITSLGGGVFRATLPVSGSRGFYQVARQPFAFNY